MRRDLREKGLKSPVDFETIARDLGLVLDGGRKARRLIYLRLWLTRLLSQLGMRTLILAATTMLSGLFVLSSITETAGSFTINLTADMLRAGFILSENADFTREESRLFSSEIEQVSNITLEDISADVDLVDGPHNGNNYLAYTFYIRNTGTETASYAYFINKDSDTMDVGRATWLMLFEDGRQIIYASASADGDPEELYGFRVAPFGEQAFAYTSHYYNVGDRYGLITVPFVDDKTVLQGLVENVAVGETHKYTVVIWIEGHDPDCTNELFGGYAKFSMDFENVSDEETASIFDGVYRKEYEEYASEFGPAPDFNPGTETSPAA